jgi:hypothetical protein
MRWVASPNYATESKRASPGGLEPLNARFPRLKQPPLLALHAQPRLRAVQEVDVSSNLELIEII